VTVCFERLLAVRWPLRARTFWRHRLQRPSAIILFICLLSIPMTLHFHITHSFAEVELADGRTVLRVFLRPHMEGYWRAATIVLTLFQVIIPVFLVGSTSVLMADALFSVCRFARSKQDPSTSPILTSSNGVHVSPAQMTPLVQIQSTQQKRATVMVLVIAVAFALFQLPSACIFIWELLEPQAPLNRGFITLGTLANSLVVSGKMANFFLFCMSSKHFRRHLRRTVLSFNRQRFSLSSVQTKTSTMNVSPALAIRASRTRPLHMRRRSQSVNGVVV